jgi:hypothetical protein
MLLLRSFSGPFQADAKCRCGNRAEPDSQVKARLSVSGRAGALLSISTEIWSMWSTSLLGRSCAARRRIHVQNLQFRKIKPR